MFLSYVLAYNNLFGLTSIISGGDINPLLFILGNTGVIVWGTITGSIYYYTGGGGVILIS